MDRQARSGSQGMLKKSQVEVSDQEDGIFGRQCREADVQSGT